MKKHLQSEQTYQAVTRAQAVVAREIEGLQALHGFFDEQFSHIVELIFSLSGRLIISGMGKSGHIGRKIAATLASTGTPSYFVHPAEASHGDLGMITRADAVLCLSNSGETAELRDIINYCRRFDIPLIALVRKAGSILQEAANIAVVLPEIPEASPVGAPTTSTLMMLAYGDALAMALLEKRGFSAEDFSVLHPGGKLGKALIRVSDIMHQGQELPLVFAKTPMKEVLLTMTAKRFGCAAVVDNEARLLGVITDGDLRRHMEKELLSKTAEQVMSKDPVVVTPNELAASALHILNEKSITCLFVWADKKVVGIIHIHDCLRAGVM